VDVFFLVLKYIARTPRLLFGILFLSYRFHFMTLSLLHNYFTPLCPSSDYFLSLDQISFFNPLVLFLIPRDVFFYCHFIFEVGARLRYL
jgi:hypothetical protein